MTQPNLVLSTDPAHQTGTAVAEAFTTEKTSKLNEVEVDAAIRIQRFVRNFQEQAAFKNMQAPTTGKVLENMQPQRTLSKDAIPILITEIFGANGEASNIFDDEKNYLIDFFRSIFSDRDIPAQQSSLQKHFVDIASSLNLEIFCKEEGIDNNNKEKLQFFLGIMTSLMIDSEQLRPSSELFHDLDTNQKDLALSLILGARNEEDFLEIRNGLKTYYPPTQNLPPLNNTDLDVVEKVIKESETNYLTQFLHIFNISQDDDVIFSRLFKLIKENSVSKPDSSVAILAAKAPYNLRTQIENELLSDKNLNKFGSSTFEDCIELLNLLEGDERENFFSLFLKTVFKNDNEGTIYEFLNRDMFDHNIDQFENFWIKLNPSERIQILTYLKDNTPFDKTVSDHTFLNSFLQLKFLSNSAKLCKAELRTLEHGCCSSVMEIAMENLIEATSVVVPSGRTRDDLNDVSEAILKNGNDKLATLSQSLSSAMIDKYAAKVKEQAETIGVLVNTLNEVKADLKYKTRVTLLFSIAILVVSLISLRNLSTLVNATSTHRRGLSTPQISDQR